MIGIKVIVINFAFTPKVNLASVQTNAIYYRRASQAQLLASQARLLGWDASAALVLKARARFREDQAGLRSSYPFEEDVTWTPRQEYEPKSVTLVEREQELVLRIGDLLPGWSWYQDRAASLKASPIPKASVCLWMACALAGDSPVACAPCAIHLPP
jgi:hypothetical protein